jgi:hypothetical protein
MFSIRTMARKVSMNNNYTRKMSYGYKDILTEIAIVGGVISAPFVATVVAVVGVTSVSIFMLDSIYHSDMVQTYRDNLDTKDELHRRNKKRDVFFQDEDNVWCVKKE